VSEANQQTEALRYAQILRRAREDLVIVDVSRICGSYACRVKIAEFIGLGSSVKAIRRDLLLE
jgi:hypothetical protein